MSSLLKSIAPTNFTLRAMTTMITAASKVLTISQNLPHLPQSLDNKLAEPPDNACLNLSDTNKAMHTLLINYSQVLNKPYLRKPFVLSIWRKNCFPQKSIPEMSWSWNIEVVKQICIKAAERGAYVRKAGLAKDESQEFWSFFNCHWNLLSFFRKFQIKLSRPTSNQVLSAAQNKRNLC